MISSWAQGEKAPKNPWRAIGLEWMVSSPPTMENFEELPIVISEPYGYGKDEPLISNSDALEGAHAT
jgi:cytochrome c oxidase subunit 1